MKPAVPPTAVERLLPGPNQPNAQSSGVETGFGRSDRAAGRFESPRADLAEMGGREEGPALVADSQAASSR